MKSPVPDTTIDGTPLATDASVLAERYRAARDAQVLNGLGAEERTRLAIVGPAVVLIVATLAASGLARDRVAIISIGVGASVVLKYVIAQRWQTMNVILALSLMGLVHGTIAATLTGGLTSPFSVVIVSATAAALPSLGRGWRPWAVLGFAGAALALLAVAPASFTGPGLPRPYSIALGAEILLVSVVLVAREILIVSEASLRAHQEVQRLREKSLVDLCQHARSLQSIGAKVAHEIRNPLTAIKGLVQLVARGEREEQGRERLSVIAAEVGRLEAIIRDYLSYARPLEELVPEALELGDLAEDVAATLAGRSDVAGVQLRVRGGATVVADGRRLKEAFINLVQNAVEASPADDTVEVDISERDGFAEVVIADHGPGIAPETLARIGTPFFTTRETGTGLGVVLARSVVAHHGGNLHFDSAVGLGTRVTVRLPVEIKGNGVDRG